MKESQMIAIDQKKGKMWKVEEEELHPILLINVKKRVEKKFKTFSTPSFY
jgi:hypothetical protein